MHMNKSQSASKNATVLIVVTASSPVKQVRHAIVSPALQWFPDEAR